jgi:UDP-N-acetylmuramoylalanine--D-glutamate ligase
MADLKLAARLPGVHNWQNAALAYARCAASCAIRARWPRITRFPGLAHRIENVGQIGKVRFVNDSKAPTRMPPRARSLLSPTFIWIAGGKPKEGGICRSRALFPTHAQSLSDRRGGGRVRQARSPASRDRAIRHARARLHAAFEDARAMRCTNRSCCCRPLARRSINSAISNSAATISVTW